MDYPNREFSFPPRDGASKFRQLADDLDCSSVFRIRLTRVPGGGMISYGMGLYRMADVEGGCTTRARA